MANRQEAIMVSQPMPIGSYLVSFSVNRQYSNIIVTIDKSNIYSKKEL
jgi:hypothetical protein